LHIIILSKPVKALYARLVPNPQSSASLAEASAPEPGQGIYPASLFGQFKLHMSMHGGCIIFAYKAARLVGCLVLLSLSLATLILEESGQIEYIVTGKKHWGKKHRKHRHSKDGEFTDAEWLQVALCLATVCFVLYTGVVRSLIN
jgi:hypothetical protein